MLTYIFQPTGRGRDQRRRCVRGRQLLRLRPRPRPLQAGQEEAGEEQDEHKGGEAKM